MKPPSHPCSSPIRRTCGGLMKSRMTAEAVTACVEASPLGKISHCEPFPRSVNYPALFMACRNARSTSSYSAPVSPASSTSHFSIHATRHPQELRAAHCVGLCWEAFSLWRRLNPSNSLEMSRGRFRSTGSASASLTKALCFALTSSFR